MSDDQPIYHVAAFDADGCRLGVATVGPDGKLDHPLTIPAGGRVVLSVHGEQVIQAITPINPASVQIHRPRFVDMPAACPECAERYRRGEGLCPRHRVRLGG